MSIVINGPLEIGAVVRSVIVENDDPQKHAAYAAALAADGKTVLDLPGAIGWVYDGEAFAAPTPDPAEQLAAERAGLNPYRLAFRRALLAVSWPGFDHGLDKVETVAIAARAADPYGAVSIWWDNVYQFVRSHPDVEDFRTNEAFHVNDDPMTEAKVDALFRLAQAIDDGADTTTITSLISDFEAEPWN